MDDLNINGMDKSGKNYKAFQERKKIFSEQNSPHLKIKQHQKGKLTARERIQILFDSDTFEEINAFATPQNKTSGFGKSTKVYGDGVITGFGNIKGKKVFVYAQDFTVLGGSLGQVHAQKIQKVQDLALKTGSPIIALIDSGGARIQEGISSLAGYAGIFYRNVSSSGIIPQISVIMGPAAGGAVYSPALTDFIFMTNKTSYMFVTGPNVVKEVLNEQVSSDELGGAEVHAKKSGVSQFVYDDEENTLIGVRKLLSYIPSNNFEQVPQQSTFEYDEANKIKLTDIVPDDPNRPYDIKDIINNLVDKDSFFEISEAFAPNIVIGFAHLQGKVIGIVANQPKVIAGTLDINASTKAARFVRYCDAYNVPLLVLEDVPGFLPGANQEHSGIIKHGAKLLYAFCDATVPRITIILRKAYGGAYIVMNSKNIGGDFNFAWPTAEIAVMGPEGAVAILYKKEIAASENPAKLKKELAMQYRDEIANPYSADEQGYIDEVIEPSQTREKLISAFSILENKHSNRPQRKHGNLPL